MSVVAETKASQSTQPSSLARDGSESIVVVGNGPVGFHFLRDLVARQPEHACSITVFGEEPVPAYDRVNLTSFLDHFVPDSLQYESAEWYAQNGIALRTGDRVNEIDRKERFVRSASGAITPYDRLVLATGSRPFMPPIPGIDQDGVFAYRTIEDLVRIRECASDCKRAAVLGGGLLGLEAAEALKRLGLEVFVVEMASVLMPRQLDNEGAELLKRQIEKPRMRVLTQKTTERILRIPDGLHLLFTNGEAVVVDMVVVSAGIRPRDELARNAELPVGSRGGIVVDDGLRTEDPSIYAIGECAEHDGKLYGLAAPGFRMASVLANQIRGENVQFTGSQEATRLKLVGVNVVFSGEYQDPVGARVHSWRTDDSYTKLLVRRGRLVGLMTVGDVQQFDRLQEAVEQERRVHWWNLRRFESTGCLWKDEVAVVVSNWPPEAVVCSCTGVTRGELTEACVAGCSSVADLARATRASSVCGSCTSLLQQIAGDESTVPGSTDAAPAIASFSVLAFGLLAFLSLASPVAHPASVQTSLSLLQFLIASSFWKQATGYGVLTLTVLSLLLSLRKRTKLLDRFSFKSLRLVHVALATLSLAMLIAHTGFHRGSNLNFVLFATFLGASISGALVGVISGTEWLLPYRLRSLRRPMTLMHILLLWPLPVLIVFHIVTVYWL